MVVELIYVNTAGEPIWLAYDNCDDAIHVQDAQQYRLDLIWRASSGTKRTYLEQAKNAKNRMPLLRCRNFAVEGEQ